MAETQPRPRKHRLDIQGIRAICMIQVLLFHAWTIGSPIGVDSFIMISAFLMAGSFIRHAEAGRAPKVLHRWVHTFKRLLPPLVVVVLVTAAASLAILPVTRWSENLIQAIASLTYWENWRLLSVATDYYAGDHSLASPFQHLWSMSMQGQIFLLWPVVMAACVWLARRLNLPIRPVAAGAFLLLTVIPLTWLVMGEHDGGIYFDTRARMWEFAFGSMIAIVAPYIHLNRWSANLLSWLGLGTLVTFCLVSIGSYPGPMGFAPMTAVSAMLLAGRPDDRWNASSVLSVRPLTALGNISYSVYLVHWPIFVLFLAAKDQERVSLQQGVSLIVISLLVAVLLHFLVDRPNQRWTWPSTPMRKLTVVALSLYVGLTPFLLTMAVQQGLQEIEESRPTYGLADPEHPGAWVLMSGVDLGTRESLNKDEAARLRSAIDRAANAYEGQDEPAAEDATNNSLLFAQEATPGPLLLSGQWAALTEPCASEDSTALDGLESSSCRMNKINSASATAKVFVVGDSHAEQLLLPMITGIAEQRKWQLTAILKGGCSYVDAAEVSGDCATRNEYARQMIERDKPDMLFVVATAAQPDGPGEKVRPGYEAAVRHAVEQGVTVVGVRDNLRSEKNLHDCPTAPDPSRPWSGCALDRSQYFAEQMPGLDLDEKIPGYAAIDMIDAFCIGNVCPTVIGNTYVYLDHNHVTKTYSESMAPFFAQRLDNALQREDAAN